MNSKARTLEPEMLNEFAQLLQERRNKLAPPFTQSSKAMWALWSIVHEREVRDIDGALARIRMGSQGPSTRSHVCSPLIRWGGGSQCRHPITRVSPWSAVTAVVNVASRARDEWVG